MIPVFEAKIENGSVNYTNPQRVREHLKSLDGKCVGVAFRSAMHRSLRSLEQNKYYWGVVVEIIADETGYTKEVMHDILRTMFLSKTLWVGTKEGNVSVTVARSTTQLDTVEFNTYIEQCKSWASMDLGLYIPDPHEVEWEGGLDL